MLSLALFGLIFMSTAQTGECKIENVPGAYIHATHKLEAAGNGRNDKVIRVNITAYGVDEKAEGAVTCVVTYTVKGAGKDRTERTKPFSISYKNRRGDARSNPVRLETGEYITVTDIKIENSWCSAK